MDHKLAWEKMNQFVANKIIWCEERLSHLQSLRLRDRQEEETTKLILHQYQELKKKIQQIEAEVSGPGDGK